MYNNDKSETQCFLVRRADSNDLYKSEICIAGEGVYEARVNLRKSVTNECILVDSLPLWVDAKSKTELTAWLFSPDATTSIESNTVTIASLKDCLWLRYIPGSVRMHGVSGIYTRFLASQNLVTVAQKLSRTGNGDDSEPADECHDDYLTFRFAAFLSSSFSLLLEVSHPTSDEWTTALEAFEGEILDVRVVCMNGGNAIRHGVSIKLGPWNTETLKLIYETALVREYNNGCWSSFKCRHNGSALPDFEFGDFATDSGVELRFKLRVGVIEAMSTLEVEAGSEEDVLGRKVGIWPREVESHNMLENECFLEAESIRRAEQKSEDDLIYMAELYFQASKEVPMALFRLGQCAELGHGIEPDDTLAYELYREAAKAGVAEAQRRVGSFLYFGRGVERDRCAAYRSYLLAALAGNMQSCYAAARCLELGEGTEKNSNRARFFYEWAAKHGNRASLQRLSVLRLDL